MFNRKLSREVAMELIFSNQIENVIESQNYFSELSDVKEIKEKDLDKEYIIELVNLYKSNEDEINKLIEENLKGWKINRISKINKAILETSITEMKYMDDIPKAVSINEALELVKKFSDEESLSFMNKVLDNILKSLE